MPDCNDCHEPFEDWVELAQHLVSQRKTHKRKSVVWALTFLAKKDNVQEFKPRLPEQEHTVFGDEQREKYIREISGKTRKVRAVCPDCRKVDELELSVEYIRDREAWRNSNGTYITMCEKCRNK